MCAGVERARRTKDFKSEATGIRFHGRAVRINIPFFICGGRQHFYHILSKIASSVPAATGTLEEQKRGTEIRY